MVLGFWDLIGLMSHMNGILLYHVLLGGHDVASLLRSGSENTMLGLSLATSYNLNFTAPTDPSFSVRQPLSSLCSLSSLVLLAM